jgi:5-formyltetrahydrofolate cyclo-ligase
MGGGYYDKTLAFKKGSEFKNKTLLVGLAYEFQKIDSIEKNAWDIPMDAIITEDKTYKA